MADSVGKATLLSPDERAASESARVQRRRERYKYWTGLVALSFSCCCCVFALIFLYGTYVAARGACCALDGQCETLFSASCSGDNHSFAGSGTDCSSFTCPTGPPTTAPTAAPTIVPLEPTPAPTAAIVGACCLERQDATTACIDSLDEVACESFAGFASSVFVEGQACSDATCPNGGGPTPGCCTLTLVGCSDDLTAIECAEAGGAVSFGDTCQETAEPGVFRCRDEPTDAPTATPTTAPTPFPTFVDPATGSCCGEPGPLIASTACFDGTNDVVCASLAPDSFASTTFIGAADGNCSTPSFCPARVELRDCCNFAASCSQSLNFTQCTVDFGGEWRGLAFCNATTDQCQVFPTPAPTPEPTPAVPTQTPTPTPTGRPTIAPPPPSPNGACCVDEQTQNCLVNQTTLQCTSQSGFYLGDASNCSTPGVCGNSLAPTPGPTPRPTEATGACCNTDSNTCSVTFTEQQCIVSGPNFVYGGGGTSCPLPGFCGAPPAPPSPAPTAGATPAPTAALPTGSCEWTCDDGNENANFCYNRVTDSNCSALEQTIEDASNIGSCFNPQYTLGGSCAAECNMCSFETHCCEAELLGNLGFVCTGTASGASSGVDCEQWFVALAVDNVNYFATATCQSNGRCA